ncbi:hypothetical protein ABZ901_00740 [Actinacidiphila alni]|uniref:hypothetical protein n=1 Tax=Actinacidiphila alni TaxID=380248 RepID=UPI003401E1A2
MNWGDVPAWVALVLAAGAGWVALLARRDSKRAADAAVEAVAIQRREAEERRQASLPRPGFTLERRGSNAFVLRNSGSGSAAGVRLVPSSLPAVVRQAPDGVALAPGAGHQFVMAGSMGSGMPTHLLVTWDGLAEPVSVAVPLYP